MHVAIQIHTDTRYGSILEHKQTSVAMHAVLRQLNRYLRAVTHGASHRIEKQITEPHKTTTAIEKPKSNPGHSKFALVATMKQELNG